MAFSNLVSKVMQNHFCQIPFVVTKVHPGSSNKDSSSYGNMANSGRACKMGNTVLAIFEKHILLKAAWGKKTSVIFKK